jgi:hypothetical protein
MLLEGNLKPFNEFAGLIVNSLNLVEFNDLASFNPLLDPFVSPDALRSLRFLSPPWDP